MTFSVLRRHRDFALVWLGGLVSLAGDWMLFTALPLHAYAVTGSPLATGAMLATRIAPRLLFSFVAGVLVDRWDRRRALIAVNLALAGSLLPLLLATSADRLWLVYAASFVQASLAQVLAPAEGAYLPRLVGDDDLLAANSLNAMNNNLARLIGPPLGGLAVATVGLAGVALADAASFLVAALMVALTRADGRPRLADDPKTGLTTEPGAPLSLRLSMWREWLDGLRYIRRERVLVVLLGFIAVSAVGEGVMGSLAVPFVIDVLGSDALGVGWLLSAQAVGGVVGSLVLAARARALDAVRMVGLGAIALGLVDFAIFNYHRFVPGLWPALVLMAVVGVPVAAMVVGLQTLGQQATQDGYRGRVLGAFAAVSACSSLLGTALGGALAGQVGIVATLTIQSAAYCLGGLLVLALLGARSPARPAPEPADP